MLVCCVDVKIAAKVMHCSEQSAGERLRYMQSLMVEDETTGRPKRVWRLVDVLARRDDWQGAKPMGRPKTKRA